MTTVAVTRHDGRLLMAADTSSEMDGTIAPAAYKAWLQPDAVTPVLFGNAGASAARFAVARHVKISGAPDATTHDDDAVDDAWDEWAAAVAESVMGVICDAQPTLLTGGQPDAAFLMAAADRFWLITHLCAQPIYRASSHYAIGSGREVALGYLDARPGDVAGAVRAAARWDPGTHLGDSGRPYLLNLPQRPTSTP